MSQEHAFDRQRRCVRCGEYRPSYPTAGYDPQCSGYPGDPGEPEGLDEDLQWPADGQDDDDLPPEAA